MSLFIFVDLLVLATLLLVAAAVTLVTADDKPNSDHPRWLAAGITLLVLSINLYVGAGLYNNSHDLPGDFGDETSQP